MTVFALAFEFDMPLNQWARGKNRLNALRVHHRRTHPAQNGQHHRHQPFEAIARKDVCVSQMPPRSLVNMHGNDMYDSTQHHQVHKRDVDDMPQGKQFFVRGELGHASNGGQVNPNQLFCVPLAPHQFH